MALVVGLFDDQQEAETAVNQLDALGLGEGNIHVMTRQRLERSDSLFGSLSRVFSTGETPLEGELIRLGLSQEEAAFYEEELDQTGVMVAAETNDELAPRVVRALRDANGVVRE